MLFDKYRDPTLKKGVFDAAINGDEANLRFYITDGADVDMRNENGLTLLQAAANAGALGSARCLLELGANPTLRGGPSAYTALHFACYRRNADMAALLLPRVPSVDDCRDMYGNNPLHLAAYMGARDVAEVLVLGGADVLKPDSRGNTPVAIAQQRFMDHDEISLPEDIRPFVETATFLQDATHRQISRHPDSVAVHEKRRQQQVEENIARLRAIKCDHLHLNRRGPRL